MHHERQKKKAKKATVDFYYARHEAVSRARNIKDKKKQIKREKTIKMKK
jgi:hypothetical protein